MAKRLCFLTLMAGIFASAVSAQTGNATITGSIMDSSGGVLPGASVSAKNVNTNAVQTSQTNPEGRYSISNLIPGTYTVTVQFGGFKDLERPGIVLRVGDRIGLDLAMEVGAAAERVTVTGEVALLRVEDVQTGLVIDNRRIQELPQYNRNALAFALLTPNVNGMSEQAGYSTDMRFNGGRTGQGEYYVDGIAVTTGYRHDVPPSVPSTDGIAEFKVLTNGLSAEYGRLSGGGVIVVSRSGTNQFHGSAYEFLRNDKLNANDWNSNRFSRAKGVFHDNVFGGTFGGPVHLPKVHNGRDKTFFFFNYEGTRRTTGTNAQLTGVPTPLERQGDFTQSLIDRGVPIQIFDPMTSRSGSGAIVVRDPFPGNRIPQARFDPLAKIYLGHYPQPNKPALAGSSHQENYIGSNATPSSNDKWSGRLDQSWNSSHVTHLTVIRYDNKSKNLRWLATPLQTASNNYGTSHTVALSHSWVVSSATLMEFRAGLMRYMNYSGSEVAPEDRSKWPMQAEVFDLLGNTTLRVPSLGMQDDTIASLGGGSVNDQRNTVPSAALSVQRLWGRHTIKFGYEHRRYYDNVMIGGSVSASSRRNQTSRTYPISDNTGSPLASYLLGIVGTGSGTQYAGPASLLPYHGAFFQDDIKLSKKLTINVGIRWDYEAPRTERFDRQTFWDNDYLWDWKPNPGWSWDQVLKIAGAPADTFQPDWLTNGVRGRIAKMGTPQYPGRTLEKRLLNHFSPRFGIAYQILPRTVLRGGYGVNWLSMTGQTWLTSDSLNVGWGDKARFLEDGTPDGGFTFPNTFSRPMATLAGYMRGTDDAVRLNNNLMGMEFNGYTPDSRAGYEHVFQFGIQRELSTGPNNWVVEVSYSGNLGRDLPEWGNCLHCLPDAGNRLMPFGSKLNIQVPNPFYGKIPAGRGNSGATRAFGALFARYPEMQMVWATGQPNGVSNYHAGYLQVEHRFARGFGFLANYTISKLLQDVGSFDNTGFGQGVAHMAQRQAQISIKDIYGIAPSDMSQKLLFNYSFEVPVGIGKRLLGNAPAALDKVVGGWQFAGTTTFFSGKPLMPDCTDAYCWSWFTIQQGRRTRLLFNTPRVPINNNVSGHQALQGSAGAIPYFNPAAFRGPVGFELGDVGSVIPDMRGPGFSQWDLSLLKNIGLGGEARRLQLRFEAQNVLNNMNAGMPESRYRNVAMGLITSQSGNPRRVMIAAKLFF